MKNGKRPPEKAGLFCFSKKLHPFAMNYKEGFIILILAVEIVLAGLILSMIAGCHADHEQSGGNTGLMMHDWDKFPTEPLDDMEEGLRCDTTYQQNIATAHTVMQARTLQFDVLSDLSSETAGNLTEFDDILHEIRATRPQLSNIYNQLVLSGEDLDAALSGKPCPDLKKHFINVSLAYATLQKQNILADRFIEAVDGYVRKNPAGDELKFARDAWVDYQKMTAVLKGDALSARKMKRKGYLLSSGQTREMLGTHKSIWVNRIPLMYAASLSNSLGVKNNLAMSMRQETLNSIPAFNYIASELSLRTHSRHDPVAINDYLTFFDRALAHGSLKEMVAPGNSTLGAMEDREILAWLLANRQELDALLTDLSLIRINRYTDARMLQLNPAQSQRMTQLIFFGRGARLLAPTNRQMIDYNGN